MMKEHVIRAVIVAMALFVPTSARAAFITFDSSSSPAVVDIGSLIDPSGLTELQGLAPSLNWAFPRFDPLLGTLQSVGIEITASMSTFLTVTNIGATPVTSGTARTSVQVFLQDPGDNLYSGFDGFGLFDSELDDPTPGFTSGSFAYTSAGAGGPLAVDETRNATRTGTETATNLYTLAAILSAFTGPGGSPGSINLEVITFTETLLTFGGGNSSASQITHALLEGSVTYNYTPFEEGPAPVPEPSSMFLLGSGILALGYSIKRRKQ